MRPDRWQKLKEVFSAALEQDPAERAAYLDQACAGDASLRTEVDSLLASHDASDRFLEQPAQEAASELFDGDAQDPLLGRRIGGYLIQKRIGQGGMGVVYLAEDTRLGRAVAIKALAPHHTRDPQYRERLRREARVAATLAHPAIATVFALEEHEEDLYIVCEYVRGRTLLEELADGPIPTTRLMETSLDIARALAAAHEMGIVHRDLKPENVIRTPEGAMKILDFGLARYEIPARPESGPPSRLTTTGMFLGTPAYASPEQLLGQEVDFHSDLFSFGVMVYEMASGRHPFAAPDSIATIARILEADPDPIDPSHSTTPSDLESIVRRCLRKNPVDRYRSTRELVAALERYHAGAMDRAAGMAWNSESAASGSEVRLPPLWWWRFHQAWIGFMYYLMLYPMWQVKQWTPGGWGSLLFFLPVAAVGVAANLRIHLWFTSHFYPVELREQRRLVAPWIRCADVFFVALLLTGAAEIYGAHAAVATLLVAVAVGSLVAFLLIEPTTARAAFTDGARAEARKSGKVI